MGRQKRRSARLTHCRRKHRAAEQRHWPCGERLPAARTDVFPAEQPVQRIGLSATIRPLEEAARFLGGQEHEGAPRPVTIVDAHYKKQLKLEVITPVDDFSDLPGGSIWPAVVPQVLGDILKHRTTLIFANNRRLAERTADRLNAQLAAERSEEIEPGSTAALAPGGLMRDRGMFAIGAEGPIRAHHGSMSKEARREMEADLKAGKLPALVGTSSLELGIDIGHVDLVVQLQSPKSVSQGLQRVGRSGHLVGQTSHGRIYATFREDLVEAAAIDMVTKHYLDKVVRSVEKDNRGWDLEIYEKGVSELGADPVYKVEVKGLSGTETVVGVTPNEYRRITEHVSGELPSYRIAVVTSALSAPKLRIFAYDQTQKVWVDEIQQKPVKLRVDEMKAAILSNF